MSLARTVWLARRGGGRRAWTTSELAQLESMVGKRTPLEMSHALNRNYNSVHSKLVQLGYVLSRDVLEPVGLTIAGLVRRLDLPKHIPYRHWRMGLIKATPKAGKKNYLVRWPDVRRYEQYIGQARAARRRALARIGVPTMTKQEFMAFMPLSETQATRYLQHRIVKCWKVPCEFTRADRQRWEWVVSKPDAERVKRLRESGQLRLRAMSYRREEWKNRDLVYSLRREKRLGRRQIGTRPCIVPGWATVAQVAAKAGLHKESVSSDIEAGILSARHITVGRRHFVAIEPAQLPAYYAWRAQNKSPHREIRRTVLVHRAGLLTVTEAANKHKLLRETLDGRIRSGKLYARQINGLTAVRDADVAAYARHLHRRAR